MEPEHPTDGQVDEALAARIERLASARGNAVQPGRPAGSTRPAGPGGPGGRANRTAQRRRHPAARSRVAALGLSMLTTGGLSYLFATADGTTAESRPIQQAQVVAAPATTNSLPQPTTADPATGPAATAPQTVTSAARVSTVDGGVYSNRYGNVQVEVQFGPGGVLSAARALQAPAGAARSIRINDSAVPALNSEALSAQSANVDAVSGATYTTESYRSSLQSAIDAARTQGITRLS